MRVAERAAARGLRVILCSAEAALPYDRVALGRALSGEAEPAALITHGAARLRELGIAYRPATPIAALDRAARVAVTARGERIGYERLVFATGSRAVRLPLPGADLPGVFLYRSIDDVLAMRRAAQAAGHAIVIGGGLLGLEAAAGLAQRGLSVSVIHPLEWPMERQLDEGAGAMLAATLRARRIRLVLSAQCIAIEGEGRARHVRLADGRSLPGELVVMAVGVRAETTLAAAAGLAVARGIVVDDAMRTSDPEILAIGECAEHRGQVCGLVAPALAMAEVAAATLAGEAARYAPRPDAAALKVSGTSVWSAGEIAPPDAEAVTLRDPGEGHYRRLWLRGHRLVGAVLFGDVADAPYYLDLLASGRDTRPIREALAFGAMAEAA
jgi:nitrite reductase (NADH) large subunit